MCVGSPTAGAWSSFQRRPDDEFETDTPSSRRAQRHAHENGCRDDARQRLSQPRVVAEVGRNRQDHDQGGERVRGKTGSRQARRHGDHEPGDRSDAGAQLLGAQVERDADQRNQHRDRNPRCQAFEQAGRGPGGHGQFLDAADTSRRYRSSTASTSADTPCRATTRWRALSAHPRTVA